MIRSGRVADAAEANGVAACLLAIAAAKSFLREAATAVLLELLEGAPEGIVAALLADSAELRGALQAPAADSTPEVGKQRTMHKTRSQSAKALDRRRP